MRTRDWTKANREVQKWEAAERMSEQGAPVTLADGWTSLIADLEARKLSTETIRKYKLLKARMTAFAADKGLSLLADFDVEIVSRFRSTWKDGPRTAGKTLERLRAFFRFAHDRKWVESNPATTPQTPEGFPAAHHAAHASRYGQTLFEVRSLLRTNSKGRRTHSGKDT